MESRDLGPAISAIIRRTVRAAAENPDPVESARSVTRATTIVGLMLEDLGDHQLKLGKRFGFWLAQIGQVAWGLVELAAPRSLGEVLFQYWIWLVYALAFAMIALGAVTGGEGVTRAGVLVGLFATVAFMIVGALRSLFRRKYWLYGVAAPLALLTTVLGGYLVFEIARTNAQISTHAKWNDIRGLMGRLGTNEDAVEWLGAPEETPKNWALARKSLALDWGFIPSYVVWFLATGALVAVRVKRLARPQAAVALIAVLAGSAAVADIIENARAWLTLSQLSTSAVPIALPYTTDAKLILAAGAFVVLIVLSAMAAIDALPKPSR
jgi:hypothetical protein